MNLSDAEYAAGLVARRLGVPVKAALLADNRLALTPTEIHANDGFSIEVKTGWRSVEVQFVPGKFARPLIKKMGEADNEARVAFSALKAAALKQGKLTFRVNGGALDAQKNLPWPPHWQKLELSLKRQGVVFEELTQNDLKQLLGNTIAPVFGMCIALIGIEDVDVDITASEGDSVEIVSRRYERKPVNREICLSLRGRRCYCCDMDFGITYGPSADGYIEVHHITPVSEIGLGYQIDPTKELVPICSNCHSVIHLTKPAMSVEQVRAMFEKKRGLT